MSPIRPPGTHGWRAVAALGLAILAGACTRHDAEFGSTGAFVPMDTVALNASLPEDTLRCATLNMSVGFPVSELLFINMKVPEVAYKAIFHLDSHYVQTRAKDRIKAMAHAIDSLKLDVVGLQEVLYYKRNGELVDDYLQELIEAIKADGGPAYLAYPMVLNDTMLTGAKGDSSIRIDLHEGNALLVNPAMSVLAVDSLRYYNVFRLDAESPTTSERGLLYAKIRSPKGVAWQVFTTHLEIFGDLSSNQAAELVKFQQAHEVRSGGKTAAPQVVLADFNVDAGTGAHRILQDAGFSDTFDSSRGDPGATCCVAGSDLWLPEAAFSERRIDYILARHWVKTVEHATALRGTFTADDGAGLFASDHRMLRAVLVAQ